METTWQRHPIRRQISAQEPGLHLGGSAYTGPRYWRAHTAIFSMIDSVMLQPLPFTRPNQLVRLLSTKDGVLRDGPSALDARDYARNNHSFQSLVVYDHWRKNVNLSIASSEPEQMVVGLVPAGYFSDAGYSPGDGSSIHRGGKSIRQALCGGDRDESLEKPFRERRRRFSGSRIRINDESYTIVAVMPDTIPDWLEVRARPDMDSFAPTKSTWLESSRGARDNTSIGRLKPGVTLEQAQADLATIAAGLAATHPIDRGIGVLLRPLADNRVGTLRPVLFMLMGAVTLVLLIACSNLANLLLARNSVRRRELAVRVAIGAGRTGLIRQLLAETLVLSLLGGVAGLVLARFGLAGVCENASARFSAKSLRLEFTLLSCSSHCSRLLRQACCLGWCRR